MHHEITLVYGREEECDGGRILYPLQGTLHHYNVDNGIMNAFRNITGITLFNLSKLIKTCSCWAWGSFLHVDVKSFQQIKMHSMEHGIKLHPSKVTTIFLCIRCLITTLAESWKAQRSKEPCCTTQEDSLQNPKRESTEKTWIMLELNPYAKKILQNTIFLPGQESLNLND